MLVLAVKEDEGPPGEQEVERHQRERLVLGGELLEDGLEGHDVVTASYYEAIFYDERIGVSLSLIPQLAIIVILLPVSADFVPH